MMKGVLFQTAFAAIVTFLQSKDVYCSPLPVNIEGKEWAKSLSLGRSSEQERATIPVQSPIIIVPPGASTSRSQLMSSEPVSTATWGKELSLGVARSQEIASTSSQIKASHQSHIMEPFSSIAALHPAIPALHPAIREQWLHEYPVHSASAIWAKDGSTSQERPVVQSTRPIVHHRTQETQINEGSSGRPIEHYTHASSIYHDGGNEGQSTVALSTKDSTASSKSESGLSHDVQKKRTFKNPEGRKKAISEGMKRMHKMKKEFEKTQEQVPSRSDIRRQESRFYQDAIKVLDEVLEGYNSQDEQRTGWRSRGAINKRIEKFNITSSGFGRAWQNMRLEFKRRYPGRKMPNFLQLSGGVRRKNKKKASRSSAIVDQSTGEEHETPPAVSSSMARVS
jgi:hypothetical protein